MAECCASLSPPAGSVRLGVRLSSWRLEAEPKMSMEFNFLLNLVRDKSERLTVLRFVRSVDQKRALLSRLLAQHVCANVLGMAYTDVVIERTAGRKPFLANRPAGSKCRNFNFNVSHEGDFVVLAAEAKCLCGVDVCSATHLGLPMGGSCVVDELRRSFDAQLSPSEWHRIERAADDQDRLTLFKTFWSCKEAFVKARGDGLQFDFARIEFEPVRIDSEGWRQAVVRVDGALPDRDWRFDVEALDKDHICTVCLGPISAVVDKIGDFKASLTGPGRDSDDLARPRPLFSLIAVDDLIPESRRAELNHIRLRHDIPPDIPTPPPSVSRDQSKLMTPPFVGYTANSSRGRFDYESDDRPLHDRTCVLN